MSLLVRHGILSLPRVSSLVEDHKAFNLDDGTFDAGEIDDIFGRFLNTLLQAK